MSTPVRKPATATTPGRKPPADTTTTASHSTNKSSTGQRVPPSISTPAAQSSAAATSSSGGLPRSPSLRNSPTPVSARAAARKPLRSNLSMSNVPRVGAVDGSSDDVRAENAALIEDLREQLRKAETLSEQYVKQLGVLQMRLDETNSEHAKTEEQLHEKEERLEALLVEAKDRERQKRELEQVYEQEKAAMLRDKDQQATREEDLKETIQRLKDTLAQKDMRRNMEVDPHISRSPSFRNRASPDIEGEFAPSSQIERSPSRANSKLILQKDKLIESLRLELAESQIKLVEMENMGDGRLQALERTLLETRMANARLMEDNESFQLLLSEKTLQGDFSKMDLMNNHEPTQAPRLNRVGSLADELDLDGEEEEEHAEPANVDQEAYKKLEVELKTQKDQNKALTLYIERIIGRLLQHDGLEHILDKEDAGPSAGTDKELPPPPPPKDDSNRQSFIQRTRSIMTGGQTGRPNSRPQSQFIQPAPEQRTANENPETAPSIPIGRSNTNTRGHRRTRSDQPVDPAAAKVVGQMFRGAPVAGRQASGGPLSPGISPTFPRGNPFFQSGPGSVASAGNRASSQSGPNSERVMSSSNSITSLASGDVGTGTEGTSSPPRSIAGSTGQNNYTGAVMTQSRLRPLRLVQENHEIGSGDQGGGGRDLDEANRKKANRGSWFGFLNRGAEENAEQ